MSGFWKPSDRGLLQEEENGDGFAIQASLLARSGTSQRLLPIAKHARQIVSALEHYEILVICGETGSGKSTQIPQFLLEYGWADSDFAIVCTQPRRIAATSLAQRVATETASRMGDQVGYCVRFDEQYSERTKILYVTDGILLREATNRDPLLSKYSVVMVDEAHERSLNSDALLGLLKKVRRRRKELRIIVCSATIDARAFLDFFTQEQHTVIEERKTKRSRWDVKNPDTDKPPHQTRGTIISVDGRQYPVDMLYVERGVPNYLTATVETAWNIHRNEGTGNILCFLPTGEDVDRCVQMAEDVFQPDIGKVEFLPLYGTLPYQQQALIFQASKRRVRRIIFATNIAETSITVPGVAFVVDSGLVKLPYFDPTTALDRLVMGPISQASARQRAGRSGRVQSGKCFRLYTEEFLRTNMKEHTPPEILRTNLTSFILTLKALGVDNILAFDMLDIPSVDALSHGLESLFALDAIDEKTSLTELGLDLSVFPTDVRVAKMLLESLSSGCSYEVLSVASALQVRNLWQRPKRGREQAAVDYKEAMNEVADPSGDHVTFVNILSAMEDYQWTQEDCRQRFVNFMALKRAMEVRKQLSRVLRQFGTVEALGPAVDEATRSKTIRRCVTAGFFFNVAKLSNDGRYYTIRRNMLVTPASSSVYSTHSPLSSEYILFGETIDGVRGGIELKAVSAIEGRWLRELAPHYWK